MYKNASRFSHQYRTKSPQYRNGPKTFGLCGKTKTKEKVKLMQNLHRKPSWELRKIIKALSMHSWLNDSVQELRLEQAKEELNRRNKEGFSVK